jgi:hypothetical protein
VIFTYGPLGFLQVPLTAVSPYSELSGLYTLAVSLGLGWTLIWTTRRAFGLLLAVPISLIVALLLILYPIISIALAWCLVALGPEPPEPVRRLFPWLAAPIAAIEVLGKISVGPLILILCAITVATMEGRRSRNLTIFASVFVATFGVLWFATGQGLSDLPQYARGGLEILSGYSRTMPLSAANDEKLYMAAAVAMTMSTLLAGYLATRRLPVIRRLGVASVLLVAGFAIWKMAFVRFLGPPTMPYLFTVALPPWLAFPWGDLRLKRLPSSVDPRALALVGLATIVVLYFPLSRPELPVLDPLERASTGIERLADLVLPARRASTNDQAREALVRYFRLSQGELALLKGQSVDVDPAEIGVAWAYGLDWRPLPVFQAYSAYTPYLDSRNRASLLAEDGPTRILRTFTSLPPSALHTSSIAAAQLANSVSNSDGRFRSWDQPQTTLAMFCNFEPLSTTRAYQVLERVANRCGPQRRLESLSVAYNQEVRVPPPPDRHDIVIADVHGMTPTGLDDLRAVLYRAPEYHVTFDRAVRYRVAPDTMSDLIVRASRGTDYPRPFGLSPQAHMMHFDKEATRLPVTDGLTIDFYAMSVRGSARGPRRSEAPRG